MKIIIIKSQLYIGNLFSPLQYSCSYDRSSINTLSPPCTLHADINLVFILSITHYIFNLEIHFTKTLSIYSSLHYIIQYTITLISSLCTSANLSISTTIYVVSVVRIRTRTCAHAQKISILLFSCLFFTPIPLFPQNDDTL